VIFIFPARELFSSYPRNIRLANRLCNVQCYARRLPFLRQGENLIRREVMESKLLPAIRKDQNPFAIGHLFGGIWGASIIFLRWTSYGCPYCENIFRRDYWQYNVHLGSGGRLCLNCGKVFDDGTREWPDLTLGRKFRFLFPPLPRAIFGGFLLAGILSPFFTPWDEHSLFVVVFAMTVGLIPLLVCSLVRLPWVLRSNRRYRELRVQLINS
jgi:hypothetical protein